MAGVRSRLSYFDDYGTAWQVDIYDANFVGTRLDWDQGVNVTINYEAEDSTTQWSNFLFSKAEISIQIKDSTEQTELEYYIDNQFEDFVVEIYKSGSIFWRGMLLTDQIERRNDPYPYTARLTASDGLKRLELVEGSANYNFQNTLAEGFVTLLLNTGVGANMAAGDTYVKTANRWYENVMPATGTGVDPFIYIKFASTTFFQFTSIDGTDLNTNALTIFRQFLKLFKLRCLMVNGCYHLIQVDQYAEGVLYLHSYPKNYPTGSASVTSFDPDVVPTLLGGGNFTYTPIIGRALAKQNVKDGGNILNLVQRSDWETQRSLTTITNFSQQAQINFEFVTGPTAFWEYTGTFPNAFLWGLKADFEIKLVLASTYYLTNKNGILEWSTTSSDFVRVRVNNINILATTGTQVVTADASPVIGGTNPIMTLPVLPAGGALTLEIDVKLIDPAGSTVSASLTLSGVSAGVKAYWVDPTQVDGEVTYRFDNDSSESTFIFDEGEYLIGDLINQNYGGALSVFNGSVYVYTSNWKRQATGTAYPIINLGLRQVLEWSDKPLEILNGTTIKSTLTALSRIELYSKKYIMNRAVYDTKADRWSGSWIEFQSSNSGITIGLEEPKDIRGGVSFAGKFARPENRYFDLLENAALRISNTTSNLSGTITSVPVAATGFDIDATTAEIVIVHPITGENDTLPLSSDWLSATTSISVTSTALSREYPQGSYIYMSIGQILQRVYNLENP